MATASSANEDSGSTRSDVLQLKEDLAAVRADLAALASTSKQLAAQELEKQSKRAREIAAAAAREAGTYRDVVADKVKDHPFASIGAALLVGLAMSSLRKR
jgi:ElaB/YqjD/DUF883 family membrane-anchored ribosome-binding protein